MQDIDYYLYQQTNLRGRSVYYADMELTAWRKQLRDRVQERLGGFPAETADLNPLLLERTTCDGYIRERIEITTYAGLRMPIYLLIPEDVSATDVKKPVIVACHGHGYGSREICGMDPDGSPRTGDPGLHKDFAVALVKRGYVVAAPELLGFGERRLNEDRDAPPGASSCTKIAAHLLMVGKTLAGHRVYETTRVLDYLSTRAEVDSERIGSMGISGGGLVTAFTAALDERCKAVVVSGYASTFHGSILDRNHCLDNYIPGILQEAELPDIIGLIAPRPLFLEIGSEDLVFPLHSAREAHERLKMIYAHAGAGQSLDADYFDGGHEISGAKAYDWLKNVL
ncbi:dienelactone hydrolase family protein [Paenibacillus pabuli]|uniref:dienelactone hydrolase family protein n=1 Tax=Paenibacillus pabuli TaxID=1472 RepID=UPI000783C82B|nr:alpha/beta hydrolase family protein [Paenibacillus pabuli]MEC0127381.1 alpha/beta hydrolase family protein [Paenibacillus pabuli]